jgi:hypothetical protein
MHLSIKNGQDNRIGRINWIDHPVDSENPVILSFWISSRNIFHDYLASPLRLLSYQS